MTVPEKWIEAQDGTMVSLAHVTRIAKNNIYGSEFSVSVFVPGLAFWTHEEMRVADETCLATGLTSYEADKFIKGLALMLGLHVTSVAPLLDAIRGILPDAEGDSEETEAR